VLDTRLLIVVGAAALLLAAISFMLGRWSAGGPPEGPAETVARQAAPPTPVEVKQRSIEDDLSFLNRVERDRREGGAAAPEREAERSGEPARPPSEPEAEPARTAPPARTAAPKPESTSSATASAPLPADSSGYLIQVFASEHRDRAEEIRARLAGKGYPATVVTTQINSKTYYRVRVGPYAQKSRATTMKNRLEREESLSTWIIRP